MALRFEGEHGNPFPSSHQYTNKIYLFFLIMLAIMYLFNIVVTTHLFIDYYTYQYLLLCLENFMVINYLAIVIIIIMYNKMHEN